jgi:alkylation response protein AidB-like acyl-CoA dehydrogenase
MRFDVDEKLIDAARTIGPVVREHGETTERERRLAKPVRDALAGAGLFRLLTPRSLGGLETDPMSAAAVIEEVASHDSAAGWALMTGNSVDWWCARLPDGGPEELYAEDPDVIIAAAFHPPMCAVRADGGYRVTGRAPLASNVHDATWLHVTALEMDGSEPRTVDGAPVVVGLIARADEAQVIDTWHALGMRGTDSNDVVLSDVFVPARRSFSLAPAFRPGWHYRGPLYRIPGMAEVAVVGPPVLLGIARAALEEFRDLAAKKTSFGSASSLAKRARVQWRLAEAEATLRSARALLYGTLAEAWQRALEGREATLGEKADVLLAATHATASAVKAVELVYSLAGTTAIYMGNSLERHFRDVETLRHHGFFSEARYETFGQVHLGMEPEFGLVAF